MKILKRFFQLVFIIIVIGLFIPQDFVMPVADATSKDYNPNSFWYYPWGNSVTHKGVDIFAKEGTLVKSSTSGIVLYSGTLSVGGNVVFVLGPKWRLHYYAHLKELKTTTFTLVDSNEVIGTVGTSGNAKGKSPHLHYAIRTLIPYPWRIDNSKQGWKKMFFLNPITYIED